MNAFNNLKVNTKIMGGYMIALVLIAVVGGVALLRLNQISVTVTDVTDNLAPDQHLADSIAVQVGTTRLYANRYIRDNSPEDLERFKQEFAALEKLLARADQDITEPERVELLKSIEAKIHEYEATFTEIELLMADRQRVQAEILDLKAGVGEEKLALLQKKAFEAGNLAEVNLAGTAHAFFQQTRLNVFKYLLRGDSQWSERVDQRYQSAQEALAQIAGIDTSGRQKLAKEVRGIMTTYYDGFTSLRDDFARQNDLVNSKLNVLGPEIAEAALKISASVDNDFKSRQGATNQIVTQTWVVVLATMAVAVLLGLSLG